MADLARGFTFGDMKSRLRRAFDNRTDLDAVFLDACNDAQRQLENMPFLPWFLEYDTDAYGTNLTTVADQKYVNQPTGFLREMEEDGGFWYQDTSGLWQPIARFDSEVNVNRQLTDTGVPKYYSILGSIIQLWPTPDAAYTLRFRYYKRDGTAFTSTDTSTTTWSTEAPMCILNFAGKMVAEDKRHVSLQMFTARFGSAYNDLRAKTYARREANRMRSMGDD